MEVVKIIIAGGRDFNDYVELANACDNIIKKLDRLTSKDTVYEIVSGGARGTDRLGELYAKEYGHGLKIFPANWDKHGRSAGILRNIEMAKYSDVLIAFWDGKSRGTKNMISEAKKRNLIVEVCKY